MKFRCPLKPPCRSRARFCRELHSAFEECPVKICYYTLGCIWITCVITKSSEPHDTAMLHMIIAQPFPPHIYICVCTIEYMYIPYIYIYVYIYIHRHMHTQYLESQCSVVFVSWCFAVSGLQLGIFEFGPTGLCQLGIRVIETRSPSPNA